MLFPGKSISASYLKYNNLYLIKELHAYLIFPVLFYSLFSVASLSLDAVLTRTQKWNLKLLHRQKLLLLMFVALFRKILRCLKNGSEEWKELFAKLQETLKPAQKEIADLKSAYKKKANELK